MAYSERKPHAARDYGVLTLLIFLSLGLIFLTNREHESGPVYRISLDLMGRISAPVWEVRELFDQRSENRLLRMENTRLRLEISAMREAFYENQRLRRLLDFGLVDRFDCVPAKVLGREPTGIHTILISAGLDDSIAVNMPVVAPDGLVGKVLNVGDQVSSVQILMDRNFRVAARDQKSRIEGIFSWAEQNYGRLEGVHHRAQISVGDTVITSGMSSIFPSGLLIGVVSNVDAEESLLFQKIRVKPTVQFETLEEVFVLRTLSKAAVLSR